MTPIPFIKMHGLGNDYVYVDCFTPSSSQFFATADIAALARRMSNRHYGIGSDGLVLILPSEVADLRMRMFNADGTEAQMCGNAARCVAKYAYESGLCNNTSMTLETLSGIKTMRLSTKDGKVCTVSVDMGKPHIVRHTIDINGTSVDITSVNMGNPHAVVFVSTPLEDIPLTSWGPLMEHHPLFAEGTNVEFVRVVDTATLSMRVWERGTGETMACGTGACAAAAAAVMQGLTDRNVAVHLKGGTLHINIDENGSVSMTGTANMVYKGEYIVEE